METIGDRIKTLREKKDYTQEYLAKQINSTKQTIYKYENNIVTNIPSDKIEMIAKILGTSPGYLMGWIEDAELFVDNIGPSVKNGDRLKSYYYNLEARELAQFLYENPDYKVLFDASRNVKKDDIEFVKQMLDKFKEQER